MPRARRSTNDGRGSRLLETAALQMQEMQATIATLRAQLGEKEADARRYRYLRGPAATSGVIDVTAPYENAYDDRRIIKGEQLDAAIDTALTKEPQP